MSEERYLLMVDLSGFSEVARNLVVPEEIRARVLQPFYTVCTQCLGRGSGAPDWRFTGDAIVVWFAPGTEGSAVVRVAREILEHARCQDWARPRQNLPRLLAKAAIVRGHCIVPAQGAHEVFPIGTAMTDLIRLEELSPPDSIVLLQSEAGRIVPDPFADFVRRDLEIRLRGGPDEVSEIVVYTHRDAAIAGALPSEPGWRVAEESRATSTAWIAAAESKATWILTALGLIVAVLVGERELIPLRGLGSAGALAFVFVTAVVALLALAVIWPRTGRGRYLRMRTCCPRLGFPTEQCCDVRTPRSRLFFRDLARMGRDNFRAELGRERWTDAREDLADQTYVLAMIAQIKMCWLRLCLGTLGVLGLILVAGVIVSAVS